MRSKNSSLGDPAPGDKIGMDLDHVAADGCAQIDAAAGVDLPVQPDLRPVVGRARNVVSTV
jgi:hypothetical protein